MSNPSSGPDRPLWSEVDIADRLRRVGPRASWWLRWRGEKACKTPDQRLSLHLERASRSLRRRDLEGAERELLSALDLPGVTAGRFDLAGIRTAREELRRTRYVPVYEEELRAASASSDPAQVRFHLAQARQAAEQLGQRDEVNWVDSLMAGPRVRTADPFRASSPTGGPSGRSSSADPSPGRSPRAVVSEETQKQQFRRVARDSRNYASKRLKRKRKDP